MHLSHGVISHHYESCNFLPNLFNHWILSLGPHRSVTLNISPENALMSTIVCDQSEEYHVYCHDLSEPSAMMDVTFLLNVYDTL